MTRLQHKRGRPSAYRLALRTAQWQETARLVRIRDRHQCRNCGGTVGLEVHHTTYYDAAGDSIVGREADHMELLITLCAVCHARQHKKQ